MSRRDRLSQAGQFARPAPSAHRRSSRATSAPALDFLTLSFVFIDILGSFVEKQLSALSFQLSADFIPLLRLKRGQGWLADARHMARDPIVPPRVFHSGPLRATFCNLPPLAFEAVQALGGVMLSEAKHLHCLLERKELQIPRCARNDRAGRSFESFSACAKGSCFWTFQAQILC